eukprot:scaffold259139_cov40-Tisochrysis_lutea.AAC.3
MLAHTAPQRAESRACPINNWLRLTCAEDEQWLCVGCVIGLHAIGITRHMATRGRFEATCGQSAHLWQQGCQCTAYLANRSQRSHQANMVGCSTEWR